MTRIDEGSQTVVDDHVGGALAGIAAGEGAIWVVESGGPSVSRISPETNTSSPRSRWATAQRASRSARARVGHQPTRQDRVEDRSDWR